MSKSSKRPNLFLIGAPKCGSSALSYYLSQHPEIAVSAIKETQFFCTDLNLPRPRSEAEYLSLFAPTAKTKYLLDSSILYMYSKRAAANIADYATQPKFLAILRNPVEATYAWHSQMTYTSNEPISDFEAALAAEASRRKDVDIPKFGTAAQCPELLYYSEVMRFGEQLERFISLFGRDQIHVVIYDDFKNDLAASLAKVYEFLDVDRTVRPSLEKVGPNKIRRYPRAHAVLKRTLARPMRAILPAHLRLRLILAFDRVTSVEGARSPLKPETASHLKDVFRQDVERLSVLIGRDVSHWCA